MKIEITAGKISMSDAPEEVDPQLEAAGRVFYVYVHRDKAGNVFYVGKGRDRRAWSTERHDVWHHYVKTRLQGQYDVEIVRSGLLNSEAEALEAELVNEQGERLVNWINSGRRFDYKAIDRYWALRQANELLIAETWPLERTDPELAVSRYRDAMNRMYEYEGIELERGLVAELTAELGGPAGNNTLLDRLTLCLCNLGRVEEAAAEADRYLAQFTARRGQGVPANVLRRIERARRLAKANRRGTTRPSGADKAPAGPCADRPSEPGSDRRPDPGEVPPVSGGEAEPPGYYQGRHFTEHLPEIDRLKRDGRDAELERLLLGVLRAIESDARESGWGVAPGCYKELAVLYRKARRYADEVRVLERFAAQKHAPGALVPELVTRLHKAQALATAKG